MSCLKPAHDPWGGPPDTLGKALHFLRMDGVFYCRAEFAGQWGVTLPPFPDHLWFHVVTEGEGWLEVGPDAQHIQPGSVALVPHGRGHRVCSEPGVPTPNVYDLQCEEISERYHTLRHGQGDGQTIMINGALIYGHPAARTLMSALPPILILESLRSPQMDWLQSTLRLIAEETRELRPGGEAVITRLGDILVVQAIRAWLDTDPAAKTGWLGALRDRQIGQAIALVHADPGRAWTVASLASEVAMSRSAFSSRFTELVGEPIMHYVTRWRMNVAMDALREQDTSIAELAARLGYQSEAAFSRAFKRVFSIPPGEARINSPEMLSMSATTPGSESV